MKELTFIIGTFISLVGWISAGIIGYQGHGFGLSYFLCVGIGIIGNIIQVRSGRGL